MNLRRVLVDGRELVILEHAVERYVERVKPHLSPDAALRELRRLLPLGEVVVEGPAWVNDQGQDSWLVVADGVAFPVVNRRLVTCLTRGSVGADLRESRRAWRREKQLKRRKSRYGPVQRDGRRRRRDERARVIDG